MLTSLWMTSLLLSLTTSTSDRTGWANELSVRLPFWEIGEIQIRFDPLSSQTNDLKIDACHLLA